MQIINATLVIQIIHFSIAYCIIRFLILKPTLSIIQQEDSVYKAFSDDVALKRAQIAQAQQEITGHWQHMRVQFEQQRPHIFLPQAPIAPVDMALSSDTQEAIQQRVAALSHAIVTRIDNVHS